MSDDKNTTEDWEEYVRSEVEALLNNFLPVSSSGNLGIRYKKAIKEQTESGTIYHEDKVTGVELILEFDFTEDMPKPM
jgi:hypothetical protein